MAVEAERLQEAHSTPKKPERSQTKSRSLATREIPVEGSPEAERMTKDLAEIYANRRRNYEGKEFTTGIPWIEISYDDVRNYYDALRDLVANGRVKRLNIDPV